MNWTYKNTIYPFPNEGVFYFKKENKRKNLDFLEKLESILTKNCDIIVKKDVHQTMFWLKDIFPIHTKDDEYVCFQPATTYHDKWEKRIFDSHYSDFVFHSFFENHNLKYSKANIKLDGGNVIRNNKHLIISEKVIFDNKDRNVIKELEEIFNLEIILLKTDPLDTTGHVDGLCRFVKNDLILLNDLIELGAPEINYYNFMLLTQKGYEVIPFPMRNYHGPKFSSVYPLNGNYINFFMNHKCIILTSFNDEMENEVTKTLEDLDLGKKIYWLDCSVITQYGGGLNCITWQW